MIVDPFTLVPTATMIGDVMSIGKKNEPFNQYPRNVAKRAESYLRESGIADEMIIGPEFEFHLFDSVSYEVGSRSMRYSVDTREAEWNAGASSPENKGYQIAQKGGYHIDVPKDVTHDLRSRMHIAEQVRRPGKVSSPRGKRLWPGRDRGRLAR